jgi:hypothetical protein
MFGQSAGEDARRTAGQRPALLSLALPSQFKRAAHRINDIVANTHPGIR